MENLKMNIKISAIIISAFVASPAIAQQSNMSTPQASDQQSPSIVRFIPGYKTGTGWKAAIEIVLKDGWKTYWRVPGDSGIPAEFIWDGSENITSITEYWPAPKRYEDRSGQSIGYKHRVVFPLNIKAADNGKQATVKLKMFYGVCSDVCIPARAQLQMQLSDEPVSDFDRDEIDAAWKKVPTPDETRIGIESVSINYKGKKPALDITLKGELADRTDILIEGYGEAYFMPPVETGNNQYAVAIEGLGKASDLVGKKLTLTIISGDMLLEKQVTVN